MVYFKPLKTFIARLIPWAVVVYRVLMVCHVELCCNHGEKVIRDRLCGYSVRAVC